MSVRAIFFDIGDTLVFDRPSLSERFWRAVDLCDVAHDPALRDAGFRMAEACALDAYVRGIDWSDPAVALECTLRAVAGAGGPALNRRTCSRLADIFGGLEACRELEPGALALLDLLRARGFVLGVISDWDRSLAELLDGWGIRQRVDAVAISGECGATKPSPLIFQAALDRAGACAAESLHVGDYYELDAAGALAIGMQALLFDWRNRTPDAPCARVTSFERLKEHLLALPAPV